MGLFILCPVWSGHHLICPFGGSATGFLCINRTGARVQAFCKNPERSAPLWLDLWGYRHPCRNGAQHSLGYALRRPRRRLLYFHSDSSASLSRPIQARLSRAGLVSAP